MRNLRKRGAVWYYDHGGKPRRWERLGTDEAVALARYEAIRAGAAVPRGTVDAMLGDYLARPPLAAAPASEPQANRIARAVGDIRQGVTMTPLPGMLQNASEPQAEPQPEAIPIAPVEVVRQALKELLESISECRMDQVTARFAKASVMARAVVDRYKDAT